MNNSNMSKPNSNNRSCMSNYQLKRNKPGNVPVPLLLQSLHGSLAVLHLLRRNVPDVPHPSAIDLPV
jgi:hypothetical protein